MSFEESKSPLNGRVLVVTALALAACALIAKVSAPHSNEAETPIGTSTSSTQNSLENEAALNELRRQLAERDREIVRLQSLLRSGPEQPKPTPATGSGSGSDNPTPLALPGQAQHTTVLQIGRFQVEQQDGRLLFKDETGQPTFVFDEARRSILAPRGVYIPSEGRLLMAEAPPEGSKSASSSQPVKISFKNETQGRLDLAWVNYQGKLVHYKTLLPGEAYRQNTFETHPWVALNSSGKIIDLVHPSKQDADSEFVFAPAARDPKAPDPAP